jgi:hypothetical protein
MDVPAIFNAVTSHAASLGVFGAGVTGHEPKAAPMNGMYAAFWLDEIGPARARSGLVATSTRLVFNARVGTNMIMEPQDDIDPTILVGVAALMSAYSGDFTLGATVAQVDLLGAYGAPMSARAGYLDHDNRKFRVMVITLPLIVDDVFTQAP